MENQVIKRETPEEKELRKKQAELNDLEDNLGEKELELATLRAELNTFEALYIHVVGVKYAELDEIEAKIAEAKLKQNPSNEDYQEEVKNARSRAKESKEATSHIEEVTKEFKPSENLKKLYRDVAKKIHPDLAEVDSERKKREELMAKANSAYQEGDIEKLRTIMNEWENSPESVKGEGAGADLIRIIRKISHVEDRLRTIEIEISQLKESELYQLKTKVEAAEDEGRDLLSEMASKMDEDIIKAKETLRVVINNLSSV